MKKWIPAAIAAISITLAVPALVLGQGGDPSFFDQGQIIVHFDPVNLVLDDVVIIGAEYYVTNNISAGLNLLSTSQTVAGTTFSTTGTLLYGRYHFMRNGDLLKDVDLLEKGNVYGFGGYGSTTNSPNGNSGLIGGAGIFFVVANNWVIDLFVNVALGDAGWDEGLASGVGYAL